VVPSEEHNRKTSSLPNAMFIPLTAVLRSIKIFPLSHMLSSAVFCHEVMNTEGTSAKSGYLYGKIPRRQGPLPVL
jgi:hypothetical protein